MADFTSYQLNEMANILILYSSIDGHTLTICHRLRQVLERESQYVKIVSLDDEADVNLALFDKVVIGASIRYGKHRPHVYEFIKRNREILNGKASAFFTVNVVARQPGKNRPETNPYMKQFRKKAAWNPKELAVLAGKIDYRKYGFWNRRIIRLIMWLTNGPTDPDTVKDFTDWDEVEAFGRRVAGM